MNTYTKVVLVALTLASIGALVTASGLEPKNYIDMLQKLLPMLQKFKCTDVTVIILQEVEQILSLLTSDCEVSLPKKTSLVCQSGRLYQSSFMKKIWKLTENPFGFMVLDRTPCVHLLGTFLDPFTRFNLEGYLQTVGLSNLTQRVLVQGAGESRESGLYGFLSKYLEMVSKFKGQFSLRPSQYETFIDDKDEWISDKFFTQQRLAGVNPMSLRKVTNNCKGNLKEKEEASIGLDLKKLEESLNPKFKWKAAVQGVLGPDYSLEKAIDEGRLYVLRYEFMDKLPREPDLTDDDTRREMWNTYSPIALFASAKDYIPNGDTKRNHLVPVAIQMDFTQDSAVYTPEDGDNWMLAKLNLQITDLGYSQIVEHLGKVHLMMEPFCVILNRALSSKHPLHLILKYHCRDITIPNSLGTPALLAEGQLVDQLFAFGNNGSARLLKDGYQIARWEVTDFRGEIKRRGLDDKELLPYFPYRDDGEQILEVIENMVKEYVDLYYYDNEDVKKDEELRDYLNELSADGLTFVVPRFFTSDGGYGKIKGLPARISTKQELCDIVTRIISQLTIQHAAVNYPLSDYAEYIPNLPTKLYNDTRVKEDNFNYSRLPNDKTSSIQASFSEILASYRFDTLFDYGNDLKDINAVEILNRYFSHLMTVVQPKMQETNQDRKEHGYLTYPYFIPRWLPNGVQT